MGWGEREVFFFQISEIPITNKLVYLKEMKTNEKGFIKGIITISNIRLENCGLGIKLTWKKIKSLQHPVFPGGHPSKY